jgi:hypothetical protein
MNVKQPREGISGEERMQVGLSGSGRLGQGGDPGQRSYWMHRWCGVIGLCGGDGEEFVGEEHFGGDAIAKFLDLAADVPKEGIAGPTTNHHDHKGRNT